MTLSSQHQTVLLREAIDALDIKPAGTYVDGTFGRGGHSRAILERLGPEGRLLALDRDPQAVAMARETRDQRLTVMHRRFSGLAEALRLGLLIRMFLSSRRAMLGELHLIWA